MLAANTLILDGKYHLQQCLGKGGQGEVWSAVEKETAKVLVIKAVLIEDDSSTFTKEALFNEARIAMGLEHPNIISIQGIEEEDSHVFLVMEYVKGFDIDALLDAVYEREDHPRLPWTIAIDIATQICNGLHYAHTSDNDDGKPAKIIHRDLKPGNVMLSTSGVAKIIDFGIAKDNDHNRKKTKTGTFKGTPSYMSPEQILATGVDHRTDIYALGVLLYQMCIGRMPIIHDNLFQLLQATLQNDPLPIPDGLIPKELEALIMQMLEKHKHDRPHTALEVKQALEEMLPKDLTGSPSDRIKEYSATFPALAPVSDNVTLAYGIDNLNGARHKRQGIDTPQNLTTDEYLVQTLEAMRNKADNAFQTRMLSADEMLDQNAGSTSKNKGMILALGVCIACLIAIVIWLITSSTPVTKQGQTKPTKQRKKVTRSSKKGSSPAPKPSATAKKQKQPPKALPRKKTTKPSRRKRLVARAKFIPLKSQLIVSIEPPCLLFSGAKRLGVAKNLKLQRTPGTYRFRCILFPQRFLRRFSIKVPAGKTVRYKRRYRKGKLFLISMPWSEIFLPPFGKLGNSQSFIELYEGKHRLILHKLGKPTHTTTFNITIKANETVKPVYKWK